MTVKINQFFFFFFFFLISTIQKAKFYCHIIHLYGSGAEVLLLNNIILMLIL
jgi:hypothetical protein